MLGLKFPGSAELPVASIRGLLWRVRVASENQDFWKVPWRVLLSQKKDIGLYRASGTPRPPRVKCELEQRSSALSSSRRIPEIPQVLYFTSIVSLYYSYLF